MIYCIDTNIIVDIFRGNENLLIKIENITKQENNFFITVLNLAELFKGAYLSEKQQDSLFVIKEFIENIETLEFTIEAAKLYGQNYAELKAKGKPTQEFDLIIASICIAHNAVLVTRNAKDFANIKELKVVQW